ncbi:MAG: restriction endonuclease subunit S [Oceanospirillaceae bacterium]|nr:restriction endonuclease subunit S [Oceanospirillaceae bacterium]
MNEVMEINATEAIENIIDCSKWTKWKFSDLVDNIVEKVVPRESGLEHYIGLEHLDSGSLKIRRFGETSTLKGDKLKIYKGDLIFAKRNAYLKRVAIADFDAVASAHSMVLRPKPENVLPEFLPFFLLSEKFWQRAIEISVGSLSPTINWKVLAKQEFLLPPKDQQAQLAKLLWAMDEVIEREKNLSDKFQDVLFSSLKEIFHKNTDTVKLIDLCSDKPKYGANSPAIEYDQETRYLRITDIGELGELNLEKVSAEKHEDKYLLKYGDFLLARSADPGRAYYYKETDGRCTHAGYLIKFSLDMTKVLPEYLYYFTQTKGFKNWITQTTRTGTLSNINSQEFSRLLIPITAVEKQIEIVEEITNLYSQLHTIKSKLNSSLSLQKSLINQVF